MNKPSRMTFQDRLSYMVEDLRNHILSGKYPSGSYIPSILHLSKDYQLSINSVQKGLDILFDEALIERIPRVGIKVKDSKEHKTISLSVGYYESLNNEIDFKYLIEQFELKHPYIKVQLVPLHFNNYLEITELYLKNEMIDAVAINHINFLNLQAQYDDISLWFEPLAADENMYSFLTDAFTVKNQLYVQPAVFSPVILCYNKQYFQNHHMPEPLSNWTWKSFMQMLDKLDSMTSSPLSFYFYPSTWNRWPIFILQSGLDFKEQPVDWSCKQVMDGIDTCYQLIHRQNTFALLLSTNETSVEKLFLEQQVPIMMTTYFQLNKLKHASFEFDIAPIPYVNTPKTLLIPIGFAINQRSKKKEAARAFVNFMTSYETQLHIRQHTYSIPASMKAAEWIGEEVIYRPTNFHMYKENSEQLCLLSDLNLSEEKMEKLLLTMSKYWTGILDKVEIEQQLAAIDQDS